MDDCPSIFRIKKRWGCFSLKCATSIIARHPAPGFNIYISHLIMRQNFQALTGFHSFHRLKNECDQFATGGFSGIKLDVYVHKLQYTPQLAQA